MIKFIWLFISISIIFIACKKSDPDPTGNYTCTCSYIINKQSYNTKTSLPTEKKSIARSQCDTTQKVYTIGGATNVNCSFN